jgi:hypothetical protein
MDDRASDYQVALKSVSSLVRCFTFLTDLIGASTRNADFRIVNRFNSIMFPS